MSTTNILAEIIVVGTFSFLWTVPIFINFWDNVCLQSLIKLNFKSTIIFLAVIYFLGTISNFIADKLFFGIDKYIVKKHGGKNQVRTNRTKIILKSSDATAYLFQRRSFVRIFRANSMNCFLGAVVVYFNVGNVTNIFSFNKSYLSLFLAIVAVLSFWAYTVTLSGYFSYVNQTGGMLE
ncbi:MAG: hypothetical protein KKE44_20405 [Proteobacteria bacterium]|nr:hypothetical protein [Pseudomonadota bacterium]MBU1585095.1 hypothetical protein [Pseudomonadota bacterium]